MPVKKFRKKPVVIEALKWTVTNVAEMKDFVGDSGIYDLVDDDRWVDGFSVPWFDLSIKTLEGVMKANIGDYIIKGVNGEFYPCKADIFEKTYEEADEEPPADGNLMYYADVT